MKHFDSSAAYAFAFFISDRRQPPSECMPFSDDSKLGDLSMRISRVSRCFVPRL
ncbi:MAG: hypothetical protein MI923_02765 [Phycisphaerales bacterium]|nr:hypothetical protein [Phycisphaerales bacterium]